MPQKGSSGKNSFSGRANPPSARMIRSSPNFSGYCDRFYHKRNTISTVPYRKYPNIFPARLAFTRSEAMQSDQNSGKTPAHCPSGNVQGFWCSDIDCHRQIMPLLRFHTVSIGFSRLAPRQIQWRMAGLLLAGVLDGSLGPCYRNIATEMGTFRGAIMS